MSEENKIFFFHLTIIFAISIAVLFVFGCASVPKDPMFSDSYVVESRPLPPHPKEKELQFPGDESQIIAISEGEPAPFSGILISEKRAARDATYRIAYEELRALYTADRSEWAAQRRAYEYDHLLHLNLQDETNSWVQRNIGAIGLNLGILIGLGTSIGYIYAEEKARELATP